MQAGRVDQTALTEAMSVYASSLVDGGYDVAEMLRQVADRSVTVLDLAGAAVVLRTDDGDLRVVATTDGRAERMVDALVTVGEGPTIHVLRTGRVMAVEDLASDDRWPEHHDSARAVGHGGLVCVPMPVGHDPVGALHLFDEGPRPWTEDELDAAVLLANMAAGYVVMAQSLADSRTLTDQLQHALDSRIVVEQAKGMVAAHGGMDVDTAFEAMRRHARSTRRRVHDVAQDVVDGRVPPRPWAWDGTPEE